jgi:uncharacterized repeat protein (TIGR03943 family)
MTFLPRLSFFAPAAVLSGWGTVMLHTVASGHINRLLSPMFRSCVLGAAVLLLVFSVGYLFLYQPAENPAPALAPAGRLRQLLRWAVLLIPLVAAATLSPDALSSTTLANRGLLNSTAGAVPLLSADDQQNVKAALSADPNQPVPVEVTDLITLSHSPAQMQSFVGRKVRSVGFVVNQGGTPKLVRWIMWCCAADAQPASVQLTGNLSTPLKDNAWYEVDGTAQFPSTLGQVVPRIEVDTIKPTEEPDEPYLSP